jgi:putative DNA primase/helicase
VFATGNGIVLTGDMTRRVVLCSLDANVERPELRRFSGNPMAEVLKNRGHYIAAALTIVRAYIVAGCPAELPSLASFGDWSRLVRSALVWLGKKDPVLTMEAARAEDPQTAQFNQVIAAWKIAIGQDKPMGAGELAKLCDPGVIGSCVSPNLESLHQAFKAVASDRTGKNIDPTRLGKWLSRHRNKITLKVKLKGDRDSHTELNKWSITATAPIGGGAPNDKYEKCHDDNF